MFGIVEHHVEPGQPQRAGDGEDERGQPAEALDLVEAPEIEHDARRDAEIDEIGEQIELGAEARGALERPRDTAVEPVEHRRGGDALTAHSIAPSKAKRIAVRPRHSASSVTRLGTNSLSGTARKGGRVRSELRRGQGRYIGTAPRQLWRNWRGGPPRAEFGDHRLARHRPGVEADHDTRIVGQIDVDARAEADQAKSVAAQRCAPSWVKQTMRRATRPAIWTTPKGPAASRSPRRCARWPGSPCRDRR